MARKRCEHEGWLPRAERMADGHPGTQFEVTSTSVRPIVLKTLVVTWTFPSHLKRAVNVKLGLAVVMHETCYYLSGFIQCLSKLKLQSRFIGNQHTSVADLVTSHLLNHLGNASFTQLKLLHPRLHAMRCRKPQHLIVFCAGCDQTRADIVSIEEHFESTAFLSGRSDSKRFMIY
jgi:hypothetical protein